MDLLVGECDLVEGEHPPSRAMDVHEEMYAVEAARPGDLVVLQDLEGTVPRSRCVHWVVLEQLAPERGRGDCRPLVARQYPHLGQAARLAVVHVEVKDVGEIRGPSAVEGHVPLRLLQGGPFRRAQLRRLYLQDLVLVEQPPPFRNLEVRARGVVPDVPEPARAARGQADAHQSRSRGQQGHGRPQPRRDHAPVSDGFRRPVRGGRTIRAMYGNWPPSVSSGGSGGRIDPCGARRCGRSSAPPGWRRFSCRRGPVPTWL